MATTHNTPHEERIRETVRDGYAAIASREAADACCPDSGCCGSAPAEVVATAVGYTSEELAELPETANMGLSCGNPTALAALSEGEIVVDLGSGGGFDVFIAGRHVGATGRSIGVDMTPEMLTKARGNIQVYRERSGLDNVEFRLGEIEHLPIADASVDAIISNCVINLSPDKAQVWREIARVLRPGGRVAVSDIALLKPLPENVAGMVESLVGCVAGAVLVEETRQMAADAGLVDIQLMGKAGYVDAMAEAKEDLYAEVVAALPPGTKLSEFVTSLNVEARKPQR